MHTLLLGKNGQLGKEINQLLESQNIPHTAVGREECDLTSREQIQTIIQNSNPTHIINATAYNNVDGAEAPEGKQTAFAVNEKALEYIINEAKKINAYLIHISTDYVFDGTKTAPYLESDTPNPLQIYGQSKLAGEKIVLGYDKGLVLRTSWVYGNGEQNFIHKFLKFAETRDELSGTSDEYSVPTSAVWLAKIIMQCAEKDLTGLFHAVPNKQASRLEWAQAICEIWKLKKSLKSVLLSSWNLPATRPSFTVMDSHKLELSLEQSFPDWKDLLQLFYNSTH